MDFVPNVVEDLTKEYVFTYEDKLNPTYFLTHLRLCDYRNLIYECQEYELVGIQPDIDKAIYKHRRRCKITREELKRMYQIPDPRG